MKTIKIAILIVIFSFTSLMTNAQFNIRGGLSNNSMGNGINTVGLTSIVEFVQSDVFMFTIGANYYLPFSFHKQTYIHAKNSGVSPNLSSVNVNYDVNLFTLNLGIKQYFTDDYSNSFGIYGILETSLVFVNQMPKVDYFDQTKYYSDSKDGVNESIYGASTNLGLGVEVAVQDYLYLFGETQLNLYFGGYNNKKGKFDEFPSMLLVNAGLRIPFD